MTSSSPHLDSPPPENPTVTRLLKWTFWVLACGLVLVGLVVWLAACPQQRAEPVAPAPLLLPQEHTATRVPSLPFTDITQVAGIDFVHHNGAYGDKLLPETMGGGCAFFDFDNDGDQDLLLVNSAPWPWQQEGQVPPPTPVLYRNDGTGHFTNVTQQVGLNVSFYGMGVAVGDYDNDGWVDLFVTAVGANHLFRNHEGTFQDVTGPAGVAGSPQQWSTSAAFLDIDNDGDLDLFVANYVAWSREVDFAVDYRLTGVGRAYGPPTSFPGAHALLYRNEGNGTFVDISATAGIQVSHPTTGLPIGKALGVMPIDVDRDGWIDVVVANDTVRNFFFHNRGDGTFGEEGMQVGVAFDRNGNATGAMGVDTAFYRNDEALGLVIGNFAGEMTSLYVAHGVPPLFTDDAIGEGIGAASRLMLTFGAFFFDADLDGRLDLLHANGHLEEEIAVVQPSQSYQQAAQLFWNTGAQAGATFVPMPADHTNDLARPIVGRGAAYADIDNDGDLDVMLTQVGGRPALLRNDQRSGHHWVRVKVRSGHANRDALGAWVTVTAGGIRQRRQVMPTRSYLSQVELPVTFGLGTAGSIESLVVEWPGGGITEQTSVERDRLVVVARGD
ncbi:MAG: CRTAC1 family protein [Deltaproteobacteria bacterium]|nr:CRTAC1 family protein [Deltaproteobacteria bacterium]